MVVPKDLSAPMASTFVASLPFAAKRPWPPARDALGGGKGIADHVADVVGDKIGLLDAEAVEHARDVAGLGLLAVASFRVGRRCPCRASLGR
jgi:hypothetical protein